MKVEAKDVEISFLNNNNFINVLYGINFSIDEKITILKGASGSGKSTILKLINAELIPSSGKLFIDGTATTSSNFDFKGFKKQVLKIDESFFDNSITALDNVALNLNLNIDYEEKIELIKKSFNNNYSLNNRYGNLSSGQRLLTILLLAKLSNCKMILLDEPTSNLDEDETKKAIECLKDIANSASLIIATNDERLNISEARYIKICQGRVVDDE